MGLRIGADIGGTFTDIAGIGDGGRGEQRWSIKLPTTHDAPEVAVIEGTMRLLALASASFSDISGFIHGTTLATNALIERKGARTALLTTHGFRDVLEMGTEGRFDQYDLRIVKPAPIVPRSLRFTARERLRYDGSVVAPLDAGDVETAARAMHAAGVEAVAVGFLHAYANGAHEAAAAAILRAVLADVPISLSHQVSPEMREYERFSTTCANAYLQPVISRYLLRLEAELHARGLVPPLLMMLSSGSLTTVATAARLPIRLLESGPAGGAIFACDLAKRLGLAKVLSLDVGGTTAKFCMIDNGEARHALSFEIGRTYRFKRGSGLPVRVPVIDLVEIGAGGGSIARVDALGRVAVGPDSAGSQPGPACYDRGGTAATVSDCDLTLGKFDPLRFAGGTMTLSTDRAHAAIARDIAAPTGLSIENAAYAVTETLCESMAAAARVHAAELGIDIAARTLIAFGGGAPLHAARFAEKLGLTAIVVPPGAGVGSAIGFLRAPPAFDVVRAARLVLPGGDLALTRQVLGEMAEDATRIVRQVVGSAAPLATRRTAHMRYRGQGHEIEVGFDHPIAADRFGEALRADFDRAYAAVYGAAMADNPVEVMAWLVRVQPAITEPAANIAEPPQHRAESGGTRRVYSGASGLWELWPWFDRTGLPPGATGIGPAIVIEDETTTIVPPGFAFRVDGLGCLRLTRESS